EDPEAGVSLRGPVTTVNEPDITILDVTVTTSAQTQFVNTTPAEFFTSADGQIVEATGTWDGTRINANTIGFEN
ncbi:MAG: hypothetical protein KJO55_01755, partial [Gammaproteobacteria bacterium]|nr:hypothetical protein [Gammaproteobacteria bacterium]